MSKKLYIGSSLFILVMFCLTLFQRLVLAPQEAATYRISALSMFITCIGIQLFYACIGLLFAFVLRKCYPRIILPRIFVWLGLFLILVFVSGILIYLTLPVSQQEWYYFFRKFWYYWLTYPSLLSVFTVLIGLAIPLDEPLYPLQRRSMIISQLVLLILCILLDRMLFVLVSSADAIFKLSRFIIIQYILIDPLFYVSLTVLAMEGLFSYWKNSIHLPWLRWVGAGLIGFIILFAIGYIFGIKLDQPIIRLYETPEVFVVSGILLSWGLHSTKKAPMVHINDQIEKGNR